MYIVTAFDLQVGAEVDVVTNGVIPQGVLVSLFTKSRNRQNLAALMVAHLIDKETRMMSNVSGGRGKEMLDTEIIKYVYMYI